MTKGDYEKALSYAEKSLVSNQIGSEAIQLKILALRKPGKTEKAKVELADLEKKDPLNHFIRFERYLTMPVPENAKLVQDHITNELPHETYLEYAIWYYRNGQFSDALKILELAPQVYPVVLLWEGYLNHLSGKKQQAALQVKNALQLSPQLVFPFSMETMKR